MKSPFPSMLLRFLPFLFAVITASSFTPKDLLSAPRTGPAIPNPNGTYAIYTQTTYSFTNDSTTGGIYLLPITKSPSPKCLIHDTSAGNPVWLDNSTILYIYTKGGESSLRSYDVESAKDNKITSFKGAIGDVKVKADDNGTVRIVFSAKVGPHGDILAANETETPEVLVYDKLWVRHWDTWITPSKNTLFSAQLSRDKDSFVISEEPRNMLNSTEDKHDLESPIPPFGGADDYSISERHLAFVAKDPHLNPATNTAAHVYVVSFNDSKYLEKINRGPGASSSPAWSPDGKYLAYLEMRVRGYEADRRRVVVFKWETHEYVYLTEDWDRSPHSILWSKDGKSLYLTTEEHGRVKLFHLPVNDKGKHPKPVISENSLTEAHWAGSDLLISQSSLISPSIFKLYSPHKDSLHNISTTWSSNPLRPQSIQEFWFPGFNNVKVHGYLTLPTNFDSKKKYPLAFLIHGGPQGAWTDSWSTRWNPAVFANAGEGWVVATINPTGSTGYGQAFTDGIQGNWGTTPYYDLEAGFDFILERYGFIDGDRAVALGASYGGYMINWIQGHPFGRKFKALVCHDGIFSTLNGFYATEELYFPEHEFYGTPWDPESVYQDHNPANFVHNWKTPQLVIHGSRDYRLTESEGLSAFTALQRQGIPSKLMIFRNENHWVLNPKSSLKWHEEVIDWITKWTSHPHADRPSVDDEKIPGFTVQE